MFLHTLPGEILLLIVARLTDRETLANWRLTCRTLALVEPPSSPRFQVLLHRVCQNECLHDLSRYDKPVAARHWHDKLNLSQVPSVTSLMYSVYLRMHSPPCPQAVESGLAVAERYINMISSDIDVKTVAPKTEIRLEAAATVIKNLYRYMGTCSPDENCLYFFYCKTLGISGRIVNLYRQLGRRNEAATMAQDVLEGLYTCDPLDVPRLAPWVAQVAECKAEDASDSHQACSDEAERLVRGMIEMQMDGPLWRPVLLSWLKHLAMIYENEPPRLWPNRLLKWRDLQSDIDLDRYIDCLP